MVPPGATIRHKQARLAGLTIEAELSALVFTNTCVLNPAAPLEAMYLQLFGAGSPVRRYLSRSANAARMQHLQQRASICLLLLMQFHKQRAIQAT